MVNKQKGFITPHYPKIIPEIDCRSSARCSCHRRKPWNTLMPIPLCCLVSWYGFGWVWWAVKLHELTVLWWVQEVNLKQFGVEQSKAVISAKKGWVKPLIKDIFPAKFSGFDSAMIPLGLGNKTWGQFTRSEWLNDVKCLVWLASPKIGWSLSHGMLLRWMSLVASSHDDSTGWVKMSCHFRHPMEPTTPFLFGVVENVGWPQEARSGHGPVAEARHRWPPDAASAREAGEVSSAALRRRSSATAQCLVNVVI